MSTKKLASLVIAMIMVLGIFGASTVKADATTDALMKMISDLQAQIAALKGGAAATTATGDVFTKDLSYGMRDAQVVKLQEVLNGAVDTTLPGTNYFGALTKAAVKKFQTENDITPVSGFVGPKTRAALNAIASPVTTGTPTQTGSTTPSTTPTPTTVADGSDGSVTASASAYVSSAQTLNKGDNKNVIAVQLKAVSGKVAVNRVDVQFNAKSGSLYPWLVYNQVVLKDASGNVLGTKTISGQSDFTTLSDGSSYLLRFDNVNMVVDPATPSTLVVAVGVMPSTDKIRTSEVDFVGIPTGGIRTVNGKGYTDTPSISTNNVTTTGGVTYSGAYATLSLNSTGSTGDLSTTVSAGSPVAQSVTVPTTNGSNKNDVVLGIFSLKMQNNGGTINGLKVKINNSLGADATTLFQNVRLVAGSQTFSADSLSSTGTTTFGGSTALGIAMTQDQWQDVKIMADVLPLVSGNPNQNGFNASTTLSIPSISAVDANYNTVTYGGGNVMASQADSIDPVTSDTVFTANGMTVTIGTIAKNATSDQNGLWKYAYPTLTFTLNNNSNNPLYISKTPSTAIGTSTTATSGYATGTVSSVTVTPGTDQVSGDTASDYIIPVNGSRTFTYSYNMTNNSGTGNSVKLSINQINYGLSGADTGSKITAGLSNLYVQVP